ncbi:S41 family peptidase [Streptomyces sp. H10-C2]|uniref:S41 family peptidase n=1 Tax=unclassified Streptomyces TaxID=2593676 RepID=UPI0024B8FBB4|nr:MULTISPECIES: S41 family peptidase [unclassified Streptomyces]MDJ0344357.1 S41 family peptidase [Streptomyces sp. PH10-H1]MDJ0373726.1 S41 family peptidase [Streptomyces sp. H10-C2]
MSGRSMFGTPRGSRRGVSLSLLVGGLGVVLATGAAAGTWANPARSAPRAQTRIPADTVADTDEIAKAIDDGKVGPEAAEELVSRSGDRWSSFYTAQEYAGLQQALDGRYVGVGLWVRRTGKGWIEVARVQSGSPAQRALVQVGDRLRSIDGNRADGKPVTDVVAELRGDNTAQSLVRLGLDHDGRSRDVTLRRAVLATEAVTVGKLAEGVTSIKIEAFTKGVGGQVRTAVLDAVHGGSRGVVLDLRGNSGGLVTEAVAVASVFLDGGLVATYDVHGWQRALYAAEGGDTGTPLVAVVDGGTMSAAELLAGALQDRGRAVVLGSRTFGKGSVQMPSELPNGSVAELTVGHYSLPDGRSVDGRGLEPDLAVGAGRAPAGTTVGTSDGAVAKAREVLSGLRPPS